MRGEQNILGLKVPNKVQKLRYGKGCRSCGGTGYKGRIAVHELLMIDEEIRKKMAQRRPAEEIFEYAVHAKLLTPLREDILKLIEEGITTIEELERIS